MTSEGLNYLPRTRCIKGKQTPLSINGLPVLYWADNSPWHEANVYFASRASQVFSGQIILSTLQSIAKSLHAYMRFLEVNTSFIWYHFPKKEADRPIHAFRGELVRARNGGEISASTAHSRMAGVIGFYRWIQANNLLSPQWPAYEDRIVGVRISDTFGFERTMRVLSTDLSIPNRSRGMVKLEDGLLPVSLEERDQILSLSREHSSIEFQLMLELGFGTGMRLGSIADLKIKTLENAQKCSETELLHYLAIGPGIKSAPVQTKFNVTGRVIIPTELLMRLRKYVDSPRRLKRESLALLEDKNMLFLNMFGKPYMRLGENRSPSMNVDMLRLKNKAKLEGINLSGFKFHRCRATFATSIAETALNNLSKGVSTDNAVALIRDLLLHKDEATSMRYITFVERQEIKSRWANDFTRFFLKK